MTTSAGCRGELSITKAGIIRTSLEAAAGRKACTSQKFRATSRRSNLSNRGDHSETTIDNDAEVVVLTAVTIRNERLNVANQCVDADESWVGLQTAQDS